VLSISSKLSRLLPALFIAVLAGGFSVPALAQGFMVKPMRMEITAAAGRVTEIPLEIRNTSGEEARNIELRVVELTQDVDGTWGLIEPSVGETNASAYSSASWTSLPQATVSVPAMQPIQIPVRLDVPPDARGVYFAGIIAETPLPPNPEGIVVRVRFLIPLLIEIVGRPVRQQVALADVEMDYHEANAGTAATTTANLVIANEGRTFSRVKGELVIERSSGADWRAVTSVTVPEKSILPGFTLELGGDLQRRLPSGSYRLRGQLFVDGRRVTPITKEIEFVGDPTAELAYDTALLLEPKEITLDIVPGATRTAVLTVENPGTNAITVSVGASTPTALSGVEMAGIRGTDLSAEPWTQIRPAEFTLAPGRRQNVRVITSIPAENTQYPNYYADLVLSGTYSDGQSAGVTRSIVHLANGRQPSSSAGTVEQLTLSESEVPTQFVLQARLVNIGNVDMNPVARAYLTTPQGTALRSVELTGDEGMLLPFGKRSYSAVMELEDLDPGYYGLLAVFRLENGQQVIRQQVVEITFEEVIATNGTTVEVPVVNIDPDAQDFPEGVKVLTDETPAITLDEGAAAGG
jgi:hypothetical protein